MLIFVSNLYSSPLCFLHRNKLVLFHLAKCVKSFITASATLCTSEGNEIKQWILSVTVMEACLIKTETDKDLGYAFCASYPPPLCCKILILCLSKRFWTCTRVPVQFHSLLYLVVQSGSQIWAGPHSHLAKLLTELVFIAPDPQIPFSAIFTLQRGKDQLSESTSRMKDLPPSRSHRHPESVEVTTDSLSQLQPAQHLMENIPKAQSSCS